MFGQRFDPLSAAGAATVADVDGLADLQAMVIEVDGPLLLLLVFGLHLHRFFLSHG